MTMLAALAVRAAVVLLATLLAAIVLRRATAATRHRVWTLGVVSVLALPLAAIAVPEWQVLPSIEAPTPIAIESAPTTTADRTPLPSPARAESTSRNDVTFTTASPLDIAHVALTIWAVVALLLLAHIAIGIFGVRRLVRRARPANARVNELLAATEVNARGRRVRVIVSDEIAMPMTWGASPAALLLPVDAVEWSDERIRAVLLHEIAHILRRDWLTHALARIAAAVHWFNPLAWVALRAMTRERERACDDYVLLQGALATDYAGHLLDIARAGHHGLRHAIAPAMARRSELEGRLLSILTPHRLLPSPVAGRVMTLAAIAVTIAIAAASPIAQTLPETQPPQTTAPPRMRHGMSGTEGTDATRVRVLTESLDDVSADVREKAALGLAMTEDRSAIAPLIEALHDSDDQVREKAALGLGFRSESSVIDPLLAALGDSSAQVREKAAIGLGMRRDPRVTDALLKAASDSDAQVREKVILALGLTGDPRATAAIAAAAKDPDAQVREKAVTALTLLKSDSRETQEAIRAGVAGALRLFGDLANPRE